MNPTRKITKTSLADQVCDAIKESVKTNEWAPGSKIPSENELAGLYGVNRLTVRMALQKLNTLGILKTRVGEGTFVREFNLVDYIREVSDMIISPGMLEDVLEFRKTFELECIRIAIANADTSDIDELEQAFHKYEDATKNAAESQSRRIHQIIEADLDFHHQLCRITKNTLFPLAFTAVREPIFQYIKAVLFKRYEDYKASGQPIEKIHGDALNSHKALVDAIRSRDFGCSQKIYLNMIDYKADIRRRQPDDQ